MDVTSVAISLKRINRMHDNTWGQVTITTEDYNKLKEEIDRLRSFAAAQTCKCKYYGDGDWVTCHRCYVLGIKRV